MAEVNCIISDYNIITPYGLGLDKNLNSILSNENAISKVSGNFGGSDFSVPHYGSLKYQDLGFKEDSEYSKHHFVAKMLIDSLQKKIEGRKVDAVLILCKHFLIKDLTPTPIPVVKKLDPNFFLANFIFHYLKTSCSLSLERDQIYEINNTCTTGTSLISMAAQGIGHNNWNNVLVMAIDIADPFTLSSLFNLGALSTHEDPNQASRPFDKKRQGFVKSDGGAIALIESEHMLKRSATDSPLRVLKFCQTSDAYHLTEGHPEGKFVELAMKNALARSNLNIKDLAFIKAHGTGTVFNDQHEFTAIKRLLGEHVASVPVTSLKGHLGHTTDASGLIETLLAGYAFHSNVILPIKNLTQTEFDLNFPTSAVKNASGRYFLSNNFGFGGYNSSIIIDKKI